MAAGGEKFLKPRRGVRDRIRPGDADRLEAFGAGACDQRAFDALDALGGGRR